MMQRRCVQGMLFALLAVFWTASVPAVAGEGGLTDLLVSQLGVSRNQAQGGAGSIFQYAKDNLSVEDFGTIAKAVPGIDEMMGSAPQAEKKSDTLGALSSMVGGDSKKLSGISVLKSSFEKLDMSGDMVGQFTPIVLDYVKKKGGEYAMSLLQNLL